MHFVSHTARATRLFANCRNAPFRAPLVTRAAKGRSGTRGRKGRGGGEGTGGREAADGGGTAGLTSTWASSVRARFRSGARRTLLRGTSLTSSFFLQWDAMDSYVLSENCPCPCMNSM